MSQPSLLVRIAAGGLTVLCVASGCGGGGSKPDGQNGSDLPRPSTSTVAAEQSFSPDKVVSLSSGKDHYCAATAVGAVFCFGENTSGELGNGTKDAFGQGPAEAVQVQGVEHAKQVSAGAAASCALLEDSTVSCWGDVPPSVGGQGPTPDDTPPDTAVTVRGVSEATSVAMGPGASCAVLSNGRVKCWDAPQSDGGGGADASAGPEYVSGLSDVSRVSVGDGFSCALLRSGSVRCWGRNAHGELGAGDLADRQRPVTVKGLTDAIAVSASSLDAIPLDVADLAHVCAVRKSGRVSCWGSALDKQLGNDVTADFDATSDDCKEPAPGETTNNIGCRTRPFTTPVDVIGVADAVDVDGTCVTRETGSVSCWGRPPSPDQTAEPDATPTLRDLPGMDDATNIAGSCVIRRTKAVSCRSIETTPPTIAGGCVVLRTGGVTCEDKPFVDVPLPEPSAQSTPSQPAETCPSVKLIGVRGSGEPWDQGTVHGLGKILNNFNTKLRVAVESKNPAGSYYPVPISYEAIKGDPEAAKPGSSFDRPLAAAYQLSVDSGVASLTSVLRGDPCLSQTSYVLAGYSQGAQVIGDTLEKGLPAGVSERIRAVVLIGDPTFNPKARNVKMLPPAKRNLIGVWDAREAGAFSVYRGRVFSFCRAGDIICQSSVPSFANTAKREAGIKRHEGYTSELDEAVSEVIARL